MTTSRAGLTLGGPVSLGPPGPGATGGISYVLPLRRDVLPSTGDDAMKELTDYLRWLSGLAEVIVVDGSPQRVFARHHVLWQEWVRHVAPDEDFVTPNRKVGGVLTGLRRAAHESVIIADDDVRYDADGLQRMAALLGDRADVVRPQNHFQPLPWHAVWDTGRTLLNRMTGGDWPGTLGVRRSRLTQAGGYAGDVLFENLELVRTILAAGGRETVAMDLFVRRIPPDPRHFWSQRVRQAYDEFARPHRLAASLALIPAVVSLAARGKWRALVALALLPAGVAEAGRRRAGGTVVFPASASLAAPLWLLERGICSWLAVLSRLAFGGVRYRGEILSRAATPMAELRRLHGSSVAAAGSKVTS